MENVKENRDRCSVRQDIADDLFRYMQEFYIGAFQRDEKGFTYTLESGEKYRISFVRE